MQLKYMELKINEKYGILAGQEAISRATESLEKNNIKVLFAKDGEEAKKIALDLMPKGAEVMNMTSMTLSTLGLDKEILEGGKYRPVRKEIETVGKSDSEDGKIKAKRLGTAQSYAIGSVHAVTEDGKVLVASVTGSQLPAYSYGALNVVWVVGAQKIVKDLDDGMKRIYEYSLPLENERAKAAYGVGSSVNKILILNKETATGRITMIIVNEKLGF
jgi:hypothetical protein